MKKRIILNLTFLLLLSFYLQSQTYTRQGKAFPLGFYPERTVEKIEKDWKEMKPFFDKALAYQDVEYIKGDFTVRSEVFYSFGRIAAMSWSAQEKVEIINYLEEFQSTIKKRLGDKGIPYSNPDLPSAYPINCIWVVLDLDFPRGCELLEKEVGNITNKLALWLLKDHYTRSDFTAYPKLKFLIESSRGNKKIINDLAFKHDLSQTKKQSKAWKKSLQHFKSVNNITNLKIAYQDLIEWAYYAFVMKDIYPELDATIPLKLATKKKTALDTYLLLSIMGSFLRNEEFYGIDVDTSYKEKYLKQYNRLYERYGTKIKEQIQTDYLAENHQFLLKEVLK